MKTSYNEAPYVAAHSSAPFSLAIPEVKNVLAKLHAEADSQRLELIPVLIDWGLDRLLGRKPTVAEEAARLKDIYIPLSPESGRSFTSSHARSARKGLSSSGLRLESRPSIWRRQCTTTAADSS